MKYLSIGVLSFLMAMGCVSKKPHASQETFSIVYTSNVLGEVEPCG
ncbi:MAG: hypothetical protein HYY61_05490 [Deltaproteobacteria bacterium]|nr:hypothetical protein [Deltaproteobacteria bacterium]